MPRPWEDKQFRERITFSFGAKSEVEPTINRDEEQVLNQTVDYLESDQLSQAISHLRTNLSESNSAALDFTLGNLFWLNQNWPEAQKAYQQALDKFPDFLRAHKHLTMTLLQEEEYEEAIKHLARTHQLGGIDAQTFGMLGYAHGQLSRHRSAARSYEMALSLEPDSIPWQTGLIQAYLQMDRPEETAGLIQDLRNRDPENSEYLRLQANNHLRRDEQEKAASVMELLLLKGDADSTLLLTLANLHSNRGLTTRAVELYLQASSDFGSEAIPSLVQAGQFLLQQNEIDKASSLLQEILTHEGTLSPQIRRKATRLEADVAKAEGDYEKAQNLFLSLREEYPRSAQIHLALADLAQRKGESGKAEIHFERALAEPNPTNRAIAHMRFAEYLANAGNWSAAIEQTDQAIALEPRDSWQEYRKALQRRVEES
ncbi:MAG: tetratricopeptide repeat protein [Opitutales bacterium]|nr:tetratricopeptide repeat protein [Opitutales bacterium]MCH8540570.1 tetratricopeptide repeat protein [Opitutales bacterium]